MLSRLRKTLPFLTVVIVAVAARDGWLFYSRWRNAREAERKAEAWEADQARRTIEMLGGGRLKILQFYASPGSVRPGESANICYGVHGAKTVRIEPQVEPLRPAISRCLSVSPSRTTIYKLVAEDSEGHTATEQLTLQVAP